MVASFAAVPISVAALTMVAVAVLSASVWMWMMAAVKIAATFGWLPKPWTPTGEELLKSAGLSARLPLVPWSPRRSVPWALIDLILLFGIWLVASLGVSALLHQMGWLPRGVEKIASLTLEQREVVIAGNIVVSALILLIGIPLIALRTGATPRDFGGSWSELWTDLRLGTIGFVMLAPPTYALQGLLIYLWQPSKHPLMEMFKGAPDTRFFVLLFVSAAFVAPLLEEMLFRVLLQGFLEKAFSFRGELHALFFGARNDRLATRDSGLGAGESLFPESRTPNPESPHSGLEEEIVAAQLAEAEPQSLSGVAAWLPIAISSAIFALLHYSHGPDWVPLFLLAAGMGYLYQRTHRLLPSLVVHSLLNSFSMWGLWVQVMHGDAIQRP